MIMMMMVMKTIIQIVTTITKMNRTTVFDKISAFLAVELIIPSESNGLIRH